MLVPLDDTAKRLGTTLDEAFVPILVICALDFDEGIVALFEV
jgi:hypothetical protein